MTGLVTGPGAVALALERKTPGPPQSCEKQPHQHRPVPWRHPKEVEHLRSPDPQSPPRLLAKRQEFPHTAAQCPGQTFWGFHACRIFFNLVWQQPPPHPLNHVSRASRSAPVSSAKPSPSSGGPAGAKASSTTATPPAAATQKEHPLLVEEREAYAKDDARPCSSHRFDTPDALRKSLGGGGHAVQSVIDSEGVVLDRAKGVWIRREAEEAQVDTILGAAPSGHMLILADSGSVRSWPCPLSPPALLPPVLALHFCFPVHHHLSRSLALRMCHRPKKSYMQANFSDARLTLRLRPP